MLDGRPAFPTCWKNTGGGKNYGPGGTLIPPGGVELIEGMSLRQWYAGQFACHYPVHVNLDGISDETAEALAKASFKFADAMLRIGKEGA